MGAEEERCAEAARLQRIDEAFFAGNLDALKAAVDDPSAIPNGPMPIAVGSCLVYAIYHSPLPFIRELLEIGADPNAPVDDGFPPSGRPFGSDGCHTREKEPAFDEQ